MSIELRYPALKCAADIDKAITGAITAAKTMKAKVQYAAIGCMILAALPGKDKDSGKEHAELAIEKANHLVLELGDGIKGDGLVKFFVYMCGFKINEALKKEGFCDVAGADWIKAHLEDAKAKPWWDYAPSKPYAGFNLSEQLAEIIKKGKNAVKVAQGDEAKAKLIEVDVDMLEILNSLISGTPVKHDHALKLVERLIPAGAEQEPTAVAAG